MLTTEWFDTNDEFEAHRRQFKNKLNMSDSGTGQYTDKDKYKVYQSYKDLGGRKGSMILGGPDAFDVTSKAGLSALMGSIGDEQMQDQVKKTLRERYFSKMEKGSMRGSILGMTCAAIGSGVLTFPSVFKQIGWVNGLVLLSMGAFGCWWSLYMLI